MTQNEQITFQLKKFLDDSSDSFHFARTTLSSGKDLRLHSHDYAEIFWIENGDGIHLVNNYEEEIKKGDLCVIRPSDTHTFIPGLNQAGLTVNNIAFKKESLENIKQRYSSLYEKYFSKENEKPFSINLDDYQLAKLINNSSNLYQQPKSNLVLDNFITYLFLLLENNTGYSNNQPHWLTFAIERFNNPAEFRKGIKRFIGLCGRNSDHVNRTLQKYFGKNLTNYINETKLKYASQQLIMTNESIKTICYDCGYNYVSYFHKIFFKHYGITPRKYRERYHKIF